MIDPLVFVAILGMAIVTWLTRIAGYSLIQRFALSGRVKAAMEALPPAILTAIIAPQALASGVPETLAAGVTILAALRFPVIVAICLGTGSVVLFRTLLG